MSVFTIYTLVPIGVDAAAGSLQTDGRATRSGSVTISIYQSREVERVQLTALVVDKYDAR